MQNKYSGVYKYVGYILDIVQASVVILVWLCLWNWIEEETLKPVYQAMEITNGRI